MKTVFCLITALILVPGTVFAQQTATPETKNATAQTTTPAATSEPAQSQTAPPETKSSAPQAQTATPETKNAAPQAQTTPPQTTVVEEIVARVNNAIITRADLRRSREQLIQETHQLEPANADKAFKERDKDVLRDLIDQQLLVQKGQELGISADVDLVKRLDEIRKQMNANSMEDLEKLAKQQGISFEDFKQNLKNGIITQQVISREVGSRVQISTADAQKYYEEHQADFQRSEQVRLSEVRIAVTDDTQTKPGETADEKRQAAVAAAEAKSTALLEQLRGGASFEEVAKKNSVGPTATQGGDLGYFKRGLLAKELEEKTFNLKVGEVTDVIRTKQGFVILKVTAHDAAGVPPLEKLRPQIQDMLYMQRIQPALRAYLAKLREDAYIDVNPSYVDSGAIANANKPIYTAATNTPSTPAKKKKKLWIF